MERMVMIKTAEVQVLTLVGHQTQLRCRLMILLEQQHTVFCLGGRMQSTVQCKDSDQCLLDGEVAVHAEHCQSLGNKRIRQNLVPYTDTLSVSVAER